MVTEFNYEVSEYLPYPQPRQTYAVWAEKRSQIIDRLKARATGHFSVGAQPIASRRRSDDS